LIAIESIVGIGLAGMGRPFFSGMMGSYNNIYPYMMGGFYSYGIVYGLELVGVITGTLVIVFALLMRSKPSDRKTFGALVLAFSVVSLVGRGGFLVGSIIGLVGGVLALTN